ARADAGSVAAVVLAVQAGNWEGAIR
ncbi:MAG: hypothetical protein RLZZ536_1866, partial [Planctomycetota bacterium]